MLLHYPHGDPAAIRKAEHIRVVSAELADQLRYVIGQIVRL